MLTGSSEMDDKTDSERSELDNAVPNNAVTSGLRSLWEQELLVDYTIQVGNHKFPVHKVVMASVSDYFRAMLAGTSRMSESKGDLVVVEGVSCEIMQILIDFIYKTQLHITKENVSEVLTGAMYLQIQPAADICTKFMLKNVDAENWFDLLSLFRSFSLWGAANEVFSYVRWDIQKIVKQFDCAKLTYEDLWVFVKDWKSSELELFHFVKKWVDAEYEERKAHLDELLSYVRYPLMTPAELLSIKEMELYHDKVSQSLSCVELVDNAVNYHKLPVHQKVLDVSEQTEIRTAPTFIIFEPEGAGGSIYDYRERHFMEYPGLKTPKNVMITKQIEVNNYLVVHTKSTKKTPVCKWYIFNPQTLSWTKMANLPGGLNNAMLVHDNSHVYAVGGYRTPWAPLITAIDQYTFHTNTWNTFSTLPEELVNFGACVLDNHLYISGGSPDNSWMDTDPVSRFNRLDLSTGVWESKAMMLDARHYHSMQVMKILGEEVICIFDDVFNLEYYSPLKDQWARCTFSFSKPLPVEKTGLTFFRGNSCFLFGVTKSTVFGKECGAFVVLEFPEEGTEVTVDYLHEYKGHLPIIYDHTVLSIGLHTKRVES